MLSRRRPEAPPLPPPRSPPPSPRPPTPPPLPPEFFQEEEIVLPQPDRVVELGHIRGPVSSVPEQYTALVWGDIPIERLFEALAFWEESIERMDPADRQFETQWAREDN